MCVLKAMGYCHIQAITMNLDDFPSLTSLEDILINDTPMLDVRAPVEFKQGAFPQSVNLPLMSDADREAIGIRYKQAGQEEAIKLGAERVKGKVKADRVQAWADFFEDNPDAVLYCFRGGLRSKITQLWIYEATGKIIPRVEGGYKALRRLLIDSIETSMQQIEPVVLSGRTGSGKTRLLYEIKSMVDLEGLANHRGSAFGRNATPQPTPISFESSLAIALLKHIKAGRTRLVFEDESRNIGSLHLPAEFFTCLKSAEIVVLTATDEERVSISTQEYITDMENAWDKLGGSFDDFADYLLSSLERIKKRLGGERYQAAKASMEQALSMHRETGDKSGYKAIITHILHDYYDPMYDYQLGNKQDRVVFSGDKQAVIAFLEARGIE